MFDEEFKPHRILNSLEIINFNSKVTTIIISEMVIILTAQMFNGNPFSILLNFRQVPRLRVVGILKITLN